MLLFAELPAMAPDDCVAFDADCAGGLPDCDSNVAQEERSTDAEINSANCLFLILPSAGSNQRWLLAARPVQFCLIRFTTILQLNLEFHGVHTEHGGKHGNRDATNSDGQKDNECRLQCRDQSRHLVAHIVVESHGCLEQDG